MLRTFEPELALEYEFRGFVYQGKLNAISQYGFSFDMSLFGYEHHLTSHRFFFFIIGMTTTVYTRSLRRRRRTFRQRSKPSGKWSTRTSEKRAMSWTLLISLVRNATV